MFMKYIFLTNIKVKFLIQKKRFISDKFFNCYFYGIFVFVSSKDVQIILHKNN